MGELRALQRFARPDGLRCTFHVSTGRDPRTARGQGGAVINYAVHSLAPTMEPLVNICASGVAERHPKLRFGAVGAGIGWVAWMLDASGAACHPRRQQPFLRGHLSDRPPRHGRPAATPDRRGTGVGRQGRARSLPARPLRRRPPARLAGRCDPDLTGEMVKRSYDPNQTYTLPPGGALRATNEGWDSCAISSPPSSRTRASSSSTTARSMS